MAKIKWVKSLAQRPAAAGVLLFNKKGELLVVKPNYKPGWQVPGGVLDKNESPTAACVRETLEEISLKIKKPKLIGVMHMRQNSEEGKEFDTFQFIFYGGRLSSKEISKIKLQADELDECRFVPVKTALKMFHTRLSLRVRGALDAHKKNMIHYAEYLPS